MNWLFAIHANALRLTDKNTLRYRNETSTNKQNNKIKENIIIPVISRFLGTNELTSG